MPLFFPVLFLLFILLPLIEVAVFIKVGALIGLLPTLAVTIGSAVLGVALVRRQGLETLAQVRAALERGEAPVYEMVDGALLVIAGFTLLTPGLVTDSLGLVLMIPPVRRALARAMLRHVLIVEGRAPASGPDVIEGDYTEIAPGRGRR